MRLPLKKLLKKREGAPEMGKEPLKALVPLLRTNGGSIEPLGLVGGTQTGTKTNGHQNAN